MARTNKLTDAQAKLAKAQAGEATASGAGKIATTIETIGKAVEPLLWLAVFGYFLWRTRTLLHVSQLREWQIKGHADPMLWLADQTGFGVGPVAATFAPANWSNSLVNIMATGGLGNIVSNYPNSHLFLNSDFDRKTAKGIVDAIARQSAMEGWWEPVWRDVDGGAPNFHHLVFEGLHVRWPAALAFAAVCTLVAKGGTALLKAIIP
jgi:hypothetical protein